MKCKESVFNVGVCSEPTEMHRETKPKSSVTKKEVKKQQDKGVRWVVLRLFKALVGYKGK